MDTLPTSNSTQPQFSPTSPDIRSSQRILRVTRYHRLRSQRFIRRRLIPGIGHYGRLGHGAYRQTLLPGMRRVTAPIQGELGKIRQRQDLAGRFRSTLIHKGLGLYLAMLSAGLVSQFFEVRGIDNLWGLTSQRTLISHDSMAMICFGVEFIVALTVFTLTEHYLEVWREHCGDSYIPQGLRRLWRR